MDTQQSQFKIYSAIYCGYCHRAKSLLKNRGYDFEEVDVTVDFKTRSWLREETGRGTVPQIWHAETYVGGYEDLVAYLSRLDAT